MKVIHEIVAFDPSMDRYFHIDGSPYDRPRALNNSLVATIRKTLRISSGEGGPIEITGHMRSKIEGAIKQRMDPKLVWFYGVSYGKQW